MIKLNYTFEISEEALELLKSLEKGKWVEYRDYEYETTKAFLDSEDYKSGRRSLEWFLGRNEDGTFLLCKELWDNDFVEDVPDSWHTTFRISDLGRKILKLNK